MANALTLIGKHCQLLQDNGDSDVFPWKASCVAIAFTPIPSILVCVLAPKLEYPRAILNLQEVLLH